MNIQIGNILDDQLLLFTREISKFCDITLVGGSVRDYILEKKSSKDLDFEIIFSNKEQENKFTIFLELKNIKVSYHELGVYKFSYLNYSFELTKARLENYNKKNVGHSDVNVTFIKELDYFNSFKRRDFTINSIGINVNDGLIDPLGGVKHISERKLVSCNYDNFYCDPVRLLRLIRFKLTLGFNLDNNINFTRFNLDELSLFYFNYELIKSKDIVFIFYLLKNKLPLKFNLLEKEKNKFSKKSITFSNKIELAISLIFKLGIENEEILCNIFYLKRNDCRNISFLKKNLYKVSLAKSKIFIPNNNLIVISKILSILNNKSIFNYFRCSKNKSITELISLYERHLIKDVDFNRVKRSNIGQYKVFVSINS